MTLAVHFALIYKHSSRYHSLPLLESIMAAGTTTRGALRAFKERIQDEDIVIIPANILTTLLESTVKHHEALVQSHDRIGCAIEQLTLNLQHVQNENRDFHSLLEKIDTLTSTIADSKVPHITSRTKEAEITDILHTYMETEAKMLESRDLATYYDELLNGDTPYAPWKFRATITPTTPEYEKPIKADATKETVRNQIRLLQRRTEHYETQLDELKAEIETMKGTLSLSKQEQLMRRMETNSIRTKLKWAKSLKRIQDNYEDDMNSGEIEFLFKVISEDTNNRGTSSRGWKHFPYYKVRKRGLTRW